MYQLINNKLYKVEKNNKSIDQREYLIDCWEERLKLVAVIK